MFKKKWVFRILVSFVLSLSLMACVVATPSEEVISDSKKQGLSETNYDKEKEIKTVEKSTLSEGNISDNNLLYSQDDDYDVTTMYLTVSFGNEADGSNHTWKEINTYSAYDYKDMGVDRYKVEGILQIDEIGNGLTKESYGYNENVPNVSVQIRGQSSSSSLNKNYKIRIKDGKDEYKGQRTINLNKHMYDSYRFVNKMCYDMLEPIPQLMSARTQFVHLYVKDLTEGEEGEFEDYGLYTMVEQVNRAYLRNHNLDENGQLYKVTFFEWGIYEAVMMDPDDPEFDRAQFEEFLEIKGDENPTKLQEVVEKVHNYNIPIDEILEEHFDTENLCYWMAYNILIGNNDVGARNLFMYSPLNSEKFYFICWDMDASFQYSYNQKVEYSDGDSWEKGMTTFLGLTLISRMMREEKYRDMLKEAVDDIYSNYVNREIVSKRVENYKAVTLQYLFKDNDHDLVYMDSLEDYYELTDLLPSEVDRQYKIFQKSLKEPWPFFVGTPIRDENTGKFLYNWDVSYDVNGEELYYDFILARDYYFEDIIYEGHYLAVPTFSGDSLEPGIYYIRVKATNESGYSMDSFDYYVIDHYGKIYDCFCFIVNDDGTIEYYEESEDV